jgi:uncharacterized protein (TIGR03437 family)
VGLNVVRYPFFLLSIFSIAGLNAAPKLRLNTATAGPVSIAVGANGPTQTVLAGNIGDGTLSLSLTSSVSWIAPTLGGPAPCAISNPFCFPINIALQTASLAKGIYTGVVTVSDPNAVDAPQDITVTVQIGGAVPDKVDLYVAPNGSTAETTFSTNNPINGQVTTANNQRWLSFSLTGTGSFRFSYPYRLAVTHLPDMAEGTYAGTVTTSGSALAADNKAIGVTMHVTSQPIALVTPPSLAVRLAQGAPPQTYNLTVANSGLGTLAVNGILSNTGAGAGPAWLSALNTGLTVTATIDPTGLSPGLYQGTLTVNANAANGAVAIPVSLQVVPQAAPRVTFQGVQDNVLFATDPIAPGENAVVIGEQFTFDAPTAGQPPPLATQVGPAQVLVNGLRAPIFNVSYGQIGFQVPYETATGTGTATLQVTRNGQIGNTVSFAVTDVAPRLMRLGVGDYGLVVNQDGSNPIPATPDGTGHPAHAGDMLMIFGTGFGQTDPSATSGAPAPGDVPEILDQTPVVIIGGGFSGTSDTVQPTFAGLSPGMVGVYEFDVVLPDDVQTGPAVPVTVTIGSSMTNVVRIAIDPAQ